MKRPSDLVAYPFFVAVYGVLALAAKNSAEVWPLDLAAPLVISLLVATIAFVLARAFTSNRHLAGVIALVIVVWFAWYGYIEQALAHQLWLQPINLPNYGMPLILLLLGVVPYVLARRYSAELPRFTRFVNLSTVFLLAIPSISLVGRWGRSRAEPATVIDLDIPRAESAPSAPVHVRRTSRPDLYVIILDEYTGARSLMANFGFDNRPFQDSLASLGFFVPRTPRSNYVHTHLALASMLNWRLLDDRPRKLKAWNGALDIDYSAIENNRTWKYLRGLGYRFVFFPSAYPGTRRNRHAEVQLPQPSKVVDEFGLVWSRSTVLIPAASLWCRSFGCGSNSFPYRPAPATLIDWKFEELAQLPDSAGPLFILAHLVLPHEPYIFNADCSHRTPYWPRTAEESDESSAREAYVEQIECTNSKILRLVSSLLGSSRTPPIIVLQADHGNGRLGAEFATLNEAGRERVEERTDPFAAYYLPDHPTNVVYDSITPVNVLPRILNHYFAAEIPLQPDATYWSTWEEPFDFARVQ